MFATKNRSSIKFMYQLIAMFLVVLLLVGCGGNIPSSEDKPDDEGKPEPVKPEAEKPEAAIQPEEQQGATSEQQQDAGSDTPGSPTTASESYGAFIEAKGEVVSILSDALASNPDTAMDSMSLLGIAMVDMLLLPASSFGLGQEAAIATLGLFGLQDVEYSENGNQYSVKHTRDDGKKYELQGVYDKAADALKCKAFIDDKHCLTYDYRKTSFGYIAQIYSVDEDGATVVFKLTLSGKNGAVGISRESAEPPALTGSETIDFPKQCPEWYAIDGDAVTGVTSDGRELSFVYTPSENGE